MSNQNIPPYVKVLEVLSKKDPKFAEVLANTIKAVDGEALDKKTRELIRLAIASILGQKEGVNIHGQQARKFGASKEEIAETLRLVFISTGIPGLYSAIGAFEE